MSLHKTSKPSLAGLARLGELADRGATALAATLRRSLHGLWQLLGSRQLYNLMVCVGVMALIVGASCVYEVQRTMVNIDRAQQVLSYAVMRQLQAAGMAPADTKGTAAAAAAPIDPALLEGPRSHPKPYPGPVEH